MKYLKLVLLGAVLFAVMYLVTSCGVFAPSYKVSKYAVQCTNPQTDWIESDLEHARKILKRYKDAGYTGCAIVRRKDGSVIEL